MHYYGSDYDLASSSLWGFWLVIAIVSLASMWRIFEKAGLSGWKSIVPIYNVYCLFKITWGNGWLFLSMIVPILNVIMSILTTYRLAKAFHKGIGFCLGLIFLEIIFLPMLAFGPAEYDPSVAQK